MVAQQPRKSVGIWIRVSTEDQAQGESPEHHEKRARLYAEAKDWNVVELYDLAGVSGKSVAEHPEAKRMLADIRRGHITGLLFSKLARLARNTRELLDFADIFREHNADLISLHESIDTSTPAGRLFFTMVAAMAQWEREEIADRVRASVPIRAKLGKSMGGKAPYGYQWKDKQVVPHPEEAPIRKLMYELFLEYRRKKAVARELNDRGYRTTNGSKFTDTTIGRLIRDPTAKGLMRVNYTKAGKRPGHVEQKPESEWVFHPVEPIVPEELWTTCNAILDEQLSGRKRPARRPVHLFAGLTFCDCGSKMYVPSRTPKYVCWSCRTKIPIADLEAIYHEQLTGYLFSDEQIADQIARTDSLVVERQDRISHLERERERVRKDMDKVYQLYADEQITSAGFGDRYRPLEERLAQIDRQLPEEQASLDILHIHHLSSREVLSEARDLHSRWPNLNPAEKRSIVEAITERIVVGKDSVEIHLHYLPGPADNGGGPRPTGGPSVPQVPETHGLSRSDAPKATQPKACNFALPFARGDYLVIYDAEDCPEPKQLKKAVAAFGLGDERLACVQAQLNYYNWNENWLTRQFAIEYAAFFDLLLPTMVRLGLPIPLGGTSTHFRTSALREAGAWDPNNVTEDADLGIRLALLGYRCGIIQSTTQEEANCRLPNWIRQRSRWIKGWLQTWLVRMRHPLRLYRRLGLKGFISFQILIGGFTLSNIVHPLFYLSMAISLAVTGVPAGFGEGAGLAIFNMFVLTTGYALAVAAGIAAVSVRKMPALFNHALMMPAYWLLISLAAYKALWQLVTRPFHWEKTEHGISRMLPPVPNFLRGRRVH